jgi:hypothetical protein
VVEDAEVHGPSVQIDPTVVSMLVRVEAHGSPPGSDELVALSSFLPNIGRSRRGLHQDQSIATETEEIVGTLRLSSGWRCSRIARR